MNYVQKLKIQAKNNEFNRILVISFWMEIIKLKNKWNVYWIERKIVRSIINSNGWERVSRWNEVSCRGEPDDRKY